MKSLNTIKASLESRRVPTHMVVAGVGPGQILAMPPTMKGLHYAKMIVAFCTEDYGAKTTARYGTIQELRYARKYKLPIISVQYGEKYPPQPRNSKEGCILIDHVFSLSTICHIDGRKKPAENIADELEMAWRSHSGGVADTE